MGAETNLTYGFRSTSKVITSTTENAAEYARFHTLLPVSGPWKVFVWHNGRAGFGNEVDAGVRAAGGGVSVLPCLISRHLDAERFNRQLFKNTQLGKEGFLCEYAPHGPHYAHQSWPVRYAYALIKTIHLTLDRWADELPFLAECYGYGIAHPMHPDEIDAIMAKGQYPEERKEELRRTSKGAYRILPKWTKGWGKLCRRFSNSAVLGYWRKGNHRRGTARLPSPPGVEDLPIPALHGWCESRCRPARNYQRHPARV